MNDRSGIELPKKNVLVFWQILLNDKVVAEFNDEDSATAAAIKMIEDSLEITAVIRKVVRAI